MADIKVKAEGQKFKFRVCGLVKNGDKVLVQKIMNNPFYCLPGGHVELGEDTKSAVNREITEEIGNSIKNEELFAIIENFFDGTENEQYHELGFYYKAELQNPIEPKDYVVVENDKGVEKRLEYKWVDKKSIQDIDFRPVVLKPLLFEESAKVEHFIINTRKDK